MYNAVTNTAPINTLATAEPRTDWLRNLTGLVSCIRILLDMELERGLTVDSSQYRNRVVSCSLREFKIASNPIKNIAMTPWRCGASERRQRIRTLLPRAHRPPSAIVAQTASKSSWI